MRVTQRMTVRNYMSDLNRTMQDYSNTNRQLTSGRRYTRLSDNVSDSARALTVREQTAQTEQALSVVSAANGPLDSAESSLMSINDRITAVKEKLVTVLGASDEAKYEIIAKEVKDIKEQVLQYINTKFADSFVFSGTNNSSPPFSLDNGTPAKLLFNGVKVEDITKNATTGKLEYTDSAGNTQIVPQNGDTYIDIGLGLTMNGTDFDPRTAFKTSFSGIEILGFGKDADGNHNNIYEIMSDIEEVLTNRTGGQPNLTRLGELNDKLKKRSEQFLIGVTDVGTRQKFLENNEERLENDLVHLGEMTNDLELVKPEEASMNLKMYDAVWNMTLQMGAKILPPSLMDYLR